MVDKNLSLHNQKQEEYVNIHNDTIDQLGYRNEERKETEIQMNFMSEKEKQSREAFEKNKKANKNHHIKNAGKRKGKKKRKKKRKNKKRSGELSGDEKNIKKVRKKKKNKQTLKEMKEEEERKKNERAMETRNRKRG